MAKTQIPAGYIAANAITATEIAANSITAAAIASDAIVVADIADNSITSAKIAANAVDSAELVSGSIDTVHIADSQVTNAKLANSSVTVNSNAVSLGSSITLDTDDIGEGSTNLYYTDARADARIAAATTDDLTEGSNLYFTNERVDDRVNALLTAGTGITLTYDDANNTLTVAGAAQYGDSDVESYLSGGTGVTFSSGVISIGQDVGTTATPTFGNTIVGTLQATSFSDGTISGITFIDEDSFATNSATRVPTQQSIKAYVDAQVAGVVDSAPAALNTLNELAAALGDDANFSTTTSTALGNRLRVDTASQGLTGTQQANAITNLGITATKAELNVLDGITATTTELNYTDGVTSNIQTQLDAKLASSSYTAADVLTKIKTVDGSGSGLDADLLDGISSGSFLRSDTSDTYSGGTLTIQAPTNGTGVFMTKAVDSPDEPAILVLAGDADSEDDLAFEIRGNGTGSSVDLSTTMSSADTKFAIFQSGHTTIGYDSLGTGYTPVNAYGLNVNGTISSVNGYYAGSTQVINSSGNWVGGTVDGRDIASDGSKLDGIESGATADQTASEILTAIKTVDGAGSGLDADLLDGISSGSFLRSDANDTYTGTLSLATNSSIRLSNQEGYGIETSDGYRVIDSVNAVLRIGDTGKHTTIRLHGGGNDDFRVYYGGVDYEIWHSGNDGAGSGLDADLLDGQQGSYYLNYNNFTNTPTLGGGTPYLDLATGNYGTVKVDDDRGVTWAGYAIRDDWVFMSNGADTSGIYNDTDNEWAALFKRNAEVELYHNGALKMETTSSGISVTGTINASTNISAGNFITSSSDPTISSNPAGGAGSLWLNSSSGEAYICTDSTSGSNIWTNVGGGSGDILPDPDIAWLVIGGGGAGTGNYGGMMGGGGAGGMRSGTHTAVPVGTVLTATVGAGGTGVYSFGNSGQGGGDSSLTGSGLQSITSFGGGGGGGDGTDDMDGGSGGGQGLGDSAPGSGTAGQGNDGGASSTNSTGGGGGGAGAAGVDAVGSTYSPGDGGDGATSSITGTSTYYAGGGGGGGERNGSWNQSSGGLGGGGAGGVNTNSSAGNGTAGTANTGGGGGAASKAAGGANSGGSGGSGVVILRVETSLYSGTTTGSPTVTTDGDYTVIKFTGSGTYTA